MEKKDYLKHLRLIRRYYMLKYKLKLADLEMLLFLYSENRFPKKTFNDYQQTMKWEKGRLDRYIEEGWVSVFREKTRSKKAMYQLTYKAKTIITQMYKLFEGALISTDPLYNPMFRKDATFRDKTYKGIAKRRNAAIRQQRHPFRK